MEVCLKREVKNRISTVMEDSIAESLDISVGDELVSINGRAVEDIIDFIFLTADVQIELVIKKPDGNMFTHKISKEFYDDIGLEFENPIMDEAKSCRNKCRFCFIDQLPKGMRETLYFKDDDSRLSFLQGNFVTLTNVTEDDLKRMIEYRISPINVSVHTTNPELRVKMLGNRFAGAIMERLKLLADNRIEVNAQIVLCPEENDGAELERTLGDLAELYPNLSSVAIVPVGLTEHREGLAPLRGFTKEESVAVIAQVHGLQEKFLETLDTRFDFLSDEFYVMADQEVPEFDDYEGFVQLENGVGLMRKFSSELEDALNDLGGKLKELPSKTATLFTGHSAYAFMNEMVQKVSERLPLQTEVVKIDNHFFGTSITVSGLIVGQDILEQSKNVTLGDFVIIPRAMMKADEDIFLDDTTLESLSKHLGKKVLIAEVDGYVYVKQMIKALKDQA